MDIKIPEEFREFSAFMWDESEAYFLLSREEKIWMAIGFLQYKSKLVAVRDFIDSILPVLKEEQLDRLWRSTSPRLAFSGDDVYTRFFTLTRDILTEAIEQGRYDPE